MDQGYIVAWGRREALLSALLGAFIAPAILILAGSLSSSWVLALVPAIAVIPVFALLVLFFRNPRRVVPMEPGLIVSPADGTVTDVTRMEEVEFLRGPAVRVGIFLSIFSVHVNRSPVSGRVEWVRRREGAHHDARRPECAAENESSSIGITRDDTGGPEGVRILVKQISGAIARRIVCPLAAGEQVARGGLVGMIKYGSRTELYLPLAAGARILVETGDKVHGGSTVIADFPRG